jgi:N-methylhydantoinase B
VAVWLVAVGHWTDVGGPVPGTFNAMATSCYAEGIRVPPVKIIDRGHIREDVINLVLANCRLAAESRGDLHAEIGACRAGEKRFFELIDKYSWETVQMTFDAMMDYSERLLMAQTSKLPDGSYEFEDYMDMDPPHPEQRPVKVKVKLEVRAGKLLFDFTGSDPAPMGSVGGSLPTTWSGVICAVLNFFPGAPFSHGALRLIEVQTTPGSCVHLMPPSPFTGMAAGALEKVIAVVLNTLGQAQPEKRTAAIYNLCNMSMAGSDPRFHNRPWIMYLWLPGGFGATARGDAGLPTMMLYGPGCKNQPIEVHERIYPILYESFGMKQDSMGPGRYRGGAGIETVFYVTEGEAEFSVIGDRHKFPIWGVEGGEPGGGQDIIVRNGQPDADSVGMLAIGVKVRRGERIRYFSGGGGGYGDPLDREKELVLADVADGLLSEQAANKQYGVVVRETDTEMRSVEIDEAATAAHRAARKAEQ